MESLSATRLAEKFKHDKTEHDKTDQNSRDAKFDKDMDTLDTDIPWEFSERIYLQIDRVSESRIVERSRQTREKGFKVEKKNHGGQLVLEISAKTDEDGLDEKIETKSDPSETFDYLLRMQIVCLNIASKAYKELERKKSNLEAQIKDIENTTVEALWRREMQELKDAHKKWEKRIADDAKVPKRTKGTKAKAKE